MSQQKKNRSGEDRVLTGSCHCGAVRFELDVAPDFKGSRCNCSVCTRTGATSAIVEPGAFRLLSPQAPLGTYAWGARISTRFFCAHCGIHCFGKGHLAEVGGDFVSVNLNCVDELDVNAIELVHWDGRHDNWGAGPGAVPWPTAGSAAA